MHSKSTAIADRRAGGRSRKSIWKEVYAPPHGRNLVHSSDRLAGTWACSKVISRQSCLCEWKETASVKLGHLFGAFHTWSRCLVQQSGGGGLRDDRQEAAHELAVKGVENAVKSADRMNLFARCLGLAIVHPSLFLLFFVVALSGLSLLR